MKGMPSNTDAERFVLGSILLDTTKFVGATGTLQEADFSLDTHRRIWRGMAKLVDEGSPIDVGTLAHVLHGQSQLQAVGGFTYLADLLTGLPQIPCIDAHVRIVKNESVLRQLAHSGKHLMNLAMEPGADPDQIIASASKNLLTLSATAQPSTLLSPASIIEKAGGATAYLDRRNRPTGLHTGFIMLDKMTGGLKPGSLTILAARPALGKTTLALNIADHVSVDGEAITLIFSLEMDKESLLDRMICSRARVDTKKFDCGYLNAEERARVTAAAGEIADGDRILIDDKAVTNLQEIHAKIRQVHAKRVVALVIIDYLQLLIGGAENRVAETSKISRDMKLIAKDTSLPIIALAQLNRACETREDKRPLLADLRESGSIEADADIVAMLYRGEVYDSAREDLRGKAELLVRKHRGGPTGMVPLLWMPNIVRFESAKEGEWSEG